MAVRLLAPAGQTRAEIETRIEQGGDILRALETDEALEDVLSRYDNWNRYNIDLIRARFEPSADLEAEYHPPERPRARVWSPDVRPPKPTESDRRAALKAQVAVRIQRLSSMLERLALWSDGGVGGS